jgi:uncharacterized delta-60 repeat protein
MKHFLLSASFLLIYFCQIHAQSPGGPDYDFGESGIIIEDLSMGVLESAECVAVQPDGKIVVGGITQIPATLSNALILLRYQSNGTPDSSFGIYGKVITDVHTLTYPNHECYKSIVLQADGKIVAGGYVQSYGSFNSVIARYLPDGTLDGDFGDGGLKVFDAGTAIYALNLLPDGKVIAAGYATTFSDKKTFSIIRMLPDGQLDPSFGVMGRVKFNIPEFTDEIATDIVVWESGNFAVAGAASQVGFGGEIGQLVFTHFLPSGEMDTLLGTQIFDYEGTSFKTALRPDNKILVTGGRDFQVVRLLNDGTIDETFGNNGRTSFAQYGARAKDLILQPDGKIVTAGHTGSFSDYALVRYWPDGTLDTGFGNEGIAINSSTEPYCMESVNAITLQSGDKIVGAGYQYFGGDGNKNISLVRFWTGNAEVVGINNTDDDKLQKTYTNPSLYITGNITSDYLRCRVSLPAPQSIQLELLHLNGISVSTWQFDHLVSGDNDLEINCQNAGPAGIYLLRLTTGGYQQMVKLIKI